MFLLSKDIFRPKKSFFNILMVNSKKGRNFGGNFHKSTMGWCKKNISRYNKMGRHQFYRTNFTQQ